MRGWALGARRQALEGAPRNAAPLEAGGDDRHALAHQIVQGAGRRLNPGDVVRCEIEGVGTIENRVVAEKV